MIKINSLDATYDPIIPQNQKNNGYPIFSQNTLPPLS